MNKLFLTLIFYCSVLFFETVHAQEVLDHKKEIPKEGQRLSVFFSDLERLYPVRFFYEDVWIEGFQVSPSYNGFSVAYILQEIFKETDLSYLILNTHSVVIVKDPVRVLRKEKVLVEALNSGKKISKVQIGVNSGKNEGLLYKLRGVVIEEESRKPIKGVSVTLTENKGVVTDELGQFEIELHAGSHAIFFSFLNFEDRAIDLDIFDNGFVEILLEESPVVLDEVVVTDRSSRDIATSAIGQTQIVMKEIKRAPALLGEVDIIKQIQTLAGVTTVGEAASGYNVRGGSVDQNLILFDGLPVFNSSHVFGFFSTFNAEAIRDVSFFRGGIPTEYGGRVSSVLDIRSKEGDYDKWKGSAGIGFVSSNILVEGPLKEGTTSIVTSLRTTYSDWMMNAIRSNYVDLRNSAVKFYDGAVKVSHKFNTRSKLAWSSYLSNDKFRLTGDSTFTWQTQLHTIKLYQTFSEKLSGSIFFGIGQYKYTVYDKNEFTGFDLSYKLTYPSAKIDFLYTAGNYKFNFGVQGIHYSFDPGTLCPSSPNSNKANIRIDQQESLETGIYLSSQFSVLKKINIDAGFRLSVFNSFGPESIALYAPDVPREISSITDTLEYKKGKPFKNYFGFEPRLGLRLELSPASSLKVGYNRLYQYLHLVTNTTAITPVDIWQPSGYYFKPQQADQISIGYFATFKEKKYDVYTEVYYKKVNNVLDFKDGAQLILNNHLETDLLQGKSRAYGVETQVSKLTGNLTGSLSYSYSRSFRTIQSVFSEERINDGLEYPSNFDQPHIVNLNWKYGFSRRHFFTGGFTYHTGRPITLPLNAYEVDGVTVTAFSERNKYRIPDYHRLDIGLVIEGNHKRKKIFDGTWTISVYNTYGRRNPYTIFFKEVRPGILRPYRLSVVGTILPSLSYNVKI